ncbi:MAG: hypothetical protein OHK0039_35270 [Bacteroidia bacterium]
MLERLQDYLRALRRRWPWVLLLSLTIGTLGLFHAYMRPTFYTAKTTFHPEGRTGNSQESALSMILGGGVENSESAVMIGILQSRRISEAVTSDTIVFHDERRLVADIILQYEPKYYSLVGWAQTRLFPQEPMTNLRSKIIYAARQIRYSLKTQSTKEGFIQMDISFYDPEITGLISRLYIDKLQEYYQEQRTEKALRNVQFYSRRADSVKRELDKATRLLARFYDRNQGLIYKEDELYPTDQQTQQEILRQMYVSLTLGREQALAQYQQDTPIIQVLDHPDPPYARVSASIALYLILGLIAGALLGTVLAIRRMLTADVRLLVMQQLKLNNAPQPETSATDEADTLD